jgi:flagellin
MPDCFSVIFVLRSFIMAQTINSNIASLNAQRNLNTSQSSLSTSLQRISSGLRINSAKDDAAGLAISERFSTQIRGLTVAARNANDGVSLAQTAEGALASVSNNLQRMRELAVQSVNSTNSDSDRVALQQEVSQLSAEIDRVATQTNFNGVKLLDGTFTAKDFQVGANAGQKITIDSIVNTRSSALGTFAGFTLTNSSIATAASDTAAASTIVVGGTSYNLGSIATDAKAISNALNNAGVSGLTATANATTVASTTATAAGAGAAVNFVINGLTINANVTTNAATNRANAVTAINAQSAVTGVTASDDGNGVVLGAADGRNVTVAAGTSTLANFGLAAATTGATINVRYEAASGITGNITGTGALAAAGSTLTTNTIASTGTAISAISVATANGAETAISALDTALNAVNAGRARLGAFQNRFASTIENLQISGENLSAARSRIQDADFASETANLSRAQILQQAGTAMVAQANQLPQGVLALLR